MRNSLTSAVISSSKYEAVLFDMDGVVTKTAQLHASAWKETFDKFLKSRGGESDFVPFDIESDYLQYVDGKPRYQGVASFISSRHIDLPEGKAQDKPGFNSIHALGNLKNSIFLKKIQLGKVEVYETTLALIHALKKSGAKVAVITASENGRQILKAAGIENVFDAVVDGVDAHTLGLRGKPFPDTFLHAAQELNVEEGNAVVIEDAEAGVEAGRLGQFGLVIGVNRANHRDALIKHGADLVVDDLDEVELAGTKKELASYAVADLGVSDESWSLVFDEYDPSLVGRREALCMLGNGYLACRAASCESVANEIHSPGSYLAGVYDRSLYSSETTSFEYEDLVNIPNWTLLQFKIEDDNWFSIDKVELQKWRQELNLREGILYRFLEFTDKKGRQTAVAERRFVHMRSTHICGIELTFTALNWDGRLTVRSAIDGSVSNIGTRLYSNMGKAHLASLSSEADKNGLFVLVKTRQSNVEIAVCASTYILIDGHEQKGTPNSYAHNGVARNDYELELKRNVRVQVQKMVAVYSSKDFAIASPEAAAKNLVLGRKSSFDLLVEEQKEAWHQLWRRFDLAIETDDVNSRKDISLLLHLHSFHVLQTVCINSVDLDVGVPARGWTEGYQGHVFWDDLFCFPFVNLRLPEVTQSLLKYRYRRLDAAREIARQRGAKGACFPWQSGSSGREETPAAIWYPTRNEWVPDYSHMQIHVNAAIVMDVWQYYQVTGNLEFLYAYGAELVMEIARFFSSIAIWNKDRERFELHGVVGPDEYHVKYPGSEHPGINNNAYTNVMASWCLCRALELIKIIPEDRCDELLERLNVSEEEVAQWNSMSAKFFVPFGESGFIEQFEGYEKLEEFPFYKDEKLDMNKLDKVFGHEGGTFNKYKVSKQADVLMLFYLFSTEELKEIFQHLGYDFDTEAFDLNVDYYIKRTSNKSTLSRVALSWVLSRIDRKNSLKLLSALRNASGENKDAAVVEGKMQMDPEHVGASWGLFREALSSDYMDIQGGTTPEGIHLGAMAGTVDIVQRCYTGMVTRDDVLWLNPNLPKGINRLSFRIQYRHQSVKVDICQRKILVTAGHSSADAIKVGSKDVVELRSGQTVVFDVKTGEVESQHQ